MAYEAFAAWYDALNTAADYDRLAGKITAVLRGNGIDSGIVADLGCGTGELTLRLADAGYDMIGVDASPDMLNELREKMREQGRSDILLLCQNLTQLDLYGTAKTMVSTFDTFNHLAPVQLAAAIEKAALFLEPEGLLIFDVNTGYKHQQVLGNNQFVIEGEGERCVWTNSYDPGTQAVTINVKGIYGDETVFEERFVEYSHSNEFLLNILGKNRLELLEITDGERFGAPTKETQRLLYVAKRLPGQPGAQF